MIENLSAPGELEQWTEGCVEALQNGDFTRIRVRNHRRLILAEYGADDILIDLSKKGQGRVYLHIESTSREVLRWFKSCVTEAMRGVQPNVHQGAAQPQNNRAQNVASQSFPQSAGSSAFDQAYRKAQEARRQASQAEQMEQAYDPDATRIAPGPHREDTFDPDATRIAQSPFERAQSRRTPAEDDADYDTFPEEEWEDEGAYDDFDSGSADDYEDQTVPREPVDYGDESPEGDTAYLDYPEDEEDDAYEAYTDDPDTYYDDAYAEDDYDAPVYDDDDDGYDSGYDADEDGYADEYADGFADDDEEAAPPQTFKEKWEALAQKTWFTILMLAVFPPLGLYLIWHYKLWTGGKRVFATAIGLLYFLFIWLGFVGVNTGVNRDVLTNLRSQTSQSTGSNVQNTPDTSSDSTDSTGTTDNTDSAASDTTTDASNDSSNTVLEQAVNQFNNWVANIVP